MNRNLIRRADASFTEWQRGMIFEKKIHRVKWEEAPEEVRAPIRRRQVELIEAVTDGPTELVRYLRSRLRLESDEMIEAPPFPPPTPPEDPCTRPA